MLIFFDTEFADESLDPRLISIGCVSEDGERTFYAELVDTYRGEHCSGFSRDVVLPLLEGGAFRMFRHELILRFGNWLEDFEQPVTLVSDALAWDWPWILNLFEAPGTWPENLSRVPQKLDRDAAFMAVVERLFATGLRRHHALDDAIVNRLGWLET